MKAIAANDRQVGGDHYKTDGVQHWDIAVQEGWDYLTGNATKYLWRWKKKNGLQDLLKARHFVDKLIEVEEERLGNGRANIVNAGRSIVSTEKRMAATINIPGPEQCTDYSY
jgi:hypothetical protein